MAVDNFVDDLSKNSRNPRVAWVCLWCLKNKQFIKSQQNQRVMILSRSKAKPSRRECGSGSGFQKMCITGIVNPKNGRYLC